MNFNSNNPLNLEDKMYTVKEFASALRNKYGANDTLSDAVLVNIFIEKYPMYACKIKDSNNPGGCGCC